MTLLNNFLQEPEFECIFHPAWGKQFVPISSSGSYQGVMQFIFVLKFSKLYRTKGILTCVVPLVIWSNCHAAFSSPQFYYVGRGEAFMKYCDKKILPGDISSFVVEPLVHLWMFAFFSKLLTKMDLSFLLLLLFLWIFS